MENNEVAKMIEDIITQSKLETKAEIKKGTTDVLNIKYDYLENDNTPDEVRYSFFIETKFDPDTLLQKIATKWNESPIGIEIVLGVIGHEIFTFQALDLIKRHLYDELAEFIIKHRGAGLGNSIGI